MQVRLCFTFKTNDSSMVFAHFPVFFTPTDRQTNQRSDTPSYRLNILIPASVSSNGQQMLLDAIHFFLGEGIVTQTNCHPDQWSIKLVNCIGRLLCLNGTFYQRISSVVRLGPDLDFIIVINWRSQMSRFRLVSFGFGFFGGGFFPIFSWF